MRNLIDLKSPNVNLVLSSLLKDRTTGKNIIFATEISDDIHFTTNITKDLLLKDNRIDISIKKFGGTGQKNAKKSRSIYAIMDLQ